MSLHHLLPLAAVSAVAISAQVRLTYPAAPKSDQSDDLHGVRVADPYRGLLLSTLFSVGSVWVGLTLSYVFPTLPPSSMIIATAVGIYTLVQVANVWLTRAPKRAAKAWLEQHGLANN